jgi:hypothetical protein
MPLPLLLPFTLPLLLSAGACPPALLLREGDACALLLVSCCRSWNCCCCCEACAAGGMGAVLGLAVLGCCSFAAVLQDTAGTRTAHVLGAAKEGLISL